MHGISVIMYFELENVLKALIIGCQHYMHIILCLHDDVDKFMRMPYLLMIFL